MLTTDEKLPAFEVLARDGATFRIWADGRVEGFPPNAVIINRIPALLGAEVQNYRTRQR